MVVDMEAEKALMQKIARVLDESGASNAAHIRKLKDLSTLRSASSSSLFFSAFSKTLIPLFAFPRRTSSAERTVRFIATFASKCDSTTAFLEEFFRFLVNAATAANKTARFRACQIISEVLVHVFPIWLPTIWRKSILVSSWAFTNFGRVSGNLLFGTLNILRNLLFFGL